MVNNANHKNSYIDTRACPRCQKKTQQEIHEVAIWTTRTCVICGYTDTRSDSE